MASEPLRSRVSPERAVQVLRYTEEDARTRKFVASGFRIGGKRVLTAAHAIRGTKLYVVSGGVEYEAFELASDNEHRADFAVLEVPGAPFDDAPVRFVSIDRTAGGTLGSCWAIGFPWFQVRKGGGENPAEVRESVQVNGFIPLGTGLVEGTLDFEVQKAPLSRSRGTPWGGFSGSVVFHRDRTGTDCVVGVVSEHRQRAGSTLVLSPMGKAQNSNQWEEWRRHLKIPDETLPVIDGKSNPVGRYVEPVQSFKPEDGSHIDLAGSPAPVELLGRDETLSNARSWLDDGDSRVLAVTGMGGIGKSSLVAKLARDVAGEFDYVFWRSLFNAEPLEIVLEECLRHISGGAVVDLPQDEDEQFKVLLAELERQRCLVIVDNLETVLTPLGGGAYLPDRTRYGDLFELFATKTHKSHLVVTSREQPEGLVRLVEKGGAQLLRLDGLGSSAVEELLLSSKIDTTESELEQLVKNFGGNPLKLNIISGSIKDLYGGDTNAFLADNVSSFEKVELLLDSQFERLPGMERDLVYWLAVRREPVSVDQLEELIFPYRGRQNIMTAAKRLSDLSLLSSAGNGFFTSQPVVVDYATNRLVEKCVAEIVDEAPDLLCSHGLIQSTAPGHIRDAQARILLTPLLRASRERLGPRAFTRRLRALLSSIRRDEVESGSYAPANILHLLLESGADPSSFDLSGLTVREADLRGAQLSGADFTDASFERSRFTDNFGMVECVAVSNKRDVLAAGTGSGEVRVWNREKNALDAAFVEHEGAVNSVVFSADDRFLYSASDDRTVRVRDVRTSRCLQVLRDHAGAVIAVAAHPRMSSLASASHDHSVRLWSAESGECLAVFEGHENWVRDVSFLPSGSELVSCSLDGTVRVWDIEQGSQLAELSDGPETFWSVAVSPNGSLVAAGGYDGIVRVWDWRNQELRHVLRNHDKRVWSMGFWNDHLLTSASSDHTIRTWNLERNGRHSTFAGHELTVKSVALLTDEKQVISGSEDHTIRTWNFETRQGDVLFHGHEQPVRSVDFSPDGKLLVSAGDDTLIQIWDAESGERMRVFDGHGHWVQVAKFSPDGDQIVSAGEDSTVRLWDVETGAATHVYQGHSGWIAAASISPDSSLIASGGTHRKLWLWDTSTENARHAIDAYESAVGAIAFTSDGTRLVTGGHDHVDAVKVWDPIEGECLAVLSGHEGGVTGLVVTANDQFIVGVGADSLIHVWDLAHGELRSSLAGHSAELKALAAHPTDPIVASGGSDRTIRLWNVESGQCLSTMTGHTRNITSIAFSPDGTTLVSASIDGTIRFWRVDSAQVIRTLVPFRPYEGMKVSSATGISDTQAGALRALGAVGNPARRGRG